MDIETCTRYLEDIAFTIFKPTQMQLLMFRDAITQNKNFQNTFEMCEQHKHSQSFIDELTYQTQLLRLNIDKLKSENEQLKSENERLNTFDEFLKDGYHIVQLEENEHAFISPKKEDEIVYLYKLELEYQQEKYTSVINSLKTQIKNQDDELISITKRFNSFKEKYEYLVQENNKMREELIEALENEKGKDEILELTNIIKQQDENNRKKDGLILSMTTKFSELEEKISELGEKIPELEEILSEFKEKISELEKKNFELEGEKTELERKTSFLEDRNTKLVKKLDLRRKYKKLLILTAQDNPELLRDHPEFEDY